MATTNPMENGNPSFETSVSSKEFQIAGILTTVHGLEELPASCEHISVLWLLHPRLQTRAIMATLAATVINAWNKHRTSVQQSRDRGLIAVAFDQRNHGSREVSSVANGSWRDGNVTHAQDMFGIYHGTTLDTSILLEHLESYIFPSPKVTQHFVLGISLGGHAAWQALFHEPAIEAAVVIIGCPDYQRLMADRARLSKLETFTSTNGATFLGSKDFPPALVRSMARWDPRGILFGAGNVSTNPPVPEQESLRRIMDSKVAGKSVLVCSGGADKLVPYRCSEPLLDFLKSATKEGGCYAGGNFALEDIVYPGVGHQLSENMVKDSIDFLFRLMEGKDLQRKPEVPRI